jgi:hypothetical protein
MTNEEKTIGIEKTKKFFDTVYELTDELIQDLKDKKLKLPEIIGLTDNVFNVILSLSSISKIVEEIKDIDNAEIKELYEYIASKGFIPEDVTDILRHLVAISQIEIEVYNEHIVPVIDIVKKMREQKK